ncbi:hypothetical protein TBLA_0D04480 [Henningerozyma blattae CBS 6284]|uniref:Calponin-homology (CH) domain-containing protein n=1 Tax=Henningerozyma blattae (strain ATCC 34711 / CBS 6284 / DSM 70876 / NBRC 10599 / NRRL Y-10934 / UCD 77-7) TaxID=1071380 RepID=I2H3J2_HENB6|nr:hypothetical protein TBLA_0D04480 [Tetrapisispora blattae CBS 6284]CCH60944.1 hypothetical protein TBLA_0D04480 [Tetrapisispora blattae CBS 6284]
MSGIGESRTELLNWLNEILHLNYKKVEECGTGAAYCQIMDSIYGDLPMHRVKFNTGLEYEYQTNYKILQSCFTRHHIDKTVYVERLIRCRFQDNLEFLQWIKKYWSQNKDASEYNPESRRHMSANPTTSSHTRNISNRPTSRSTSTNFNNNNNNTGNNTLSVSKRRVSGNVTGASRGYGSSQYNNNTNNLRSSSGYNSASNNNTNNNRNYSTEQITKLQTQLSTAQSEIKDLKNDNEKWKETVEVAQRERDFYFGKLRDIEIFTLATLDLIKEGTQPSETIDLTNALTKIQNILYATEEGFYEAPIEEDLPSDIKTNDNGHTHLSEQPTSNSYSINIQPENTAPNESTNHLIINNNDNQNIFNDRATDPGSLTSGNMPLNDDEMF